MNRIALLLIIAAPLLTHAQSNDTPVAETPPTLAVPAPRRTLEVVEGEPPPPSYHVGSRPRFALVAAGGAAFLVSYAPTAYFSAGVGSFQTLLCAVSPEDCNMSGWFGLIPVAGPMLLTAYANLPLGLGIAASAVQAVGALTLIAGFVFPKPVWVLNRRHAPAVTMSLTGAGVQAQF